MISSCLADLKTQYNKHMEIQACDLARPPSSGLSPRLSHPRPQALQHFLSVVRWLVLTCVLLIALP